MKILFLNTNLGYAGAEKMIAWVANQCAINGFEVTFLTYREDFNFQQLHKSIRHIHVHLEDDGASFNLLSTVWYLHKFIKKECFDVAIAFLSPSILRLSLAAIGTKTKILVSQRGDPYVQYKNTGLKFKLARWINNFALRNADAFVFQTKQAMNYYRLSKRKHSIVIPNPIKPLVRTMSRAGNVRNAIVNVGRIDFYQKRQDLLVESFLKIREKYPDVVLEFYGDGEDEGKLLNLIDGIEQIKYMGKTQDVASVIQNAAIFVLSSDFEGIPNALLEAMSLGVPCISTDCSPGGAALLINNQQNGLLVPRSDSEQLSKAMSYYLDNYETAELHGISAMKVVEDFSEERISKMWINFIMQL